MAECVQCGGLYEAKRASSKYCSGSCRARAQRRAPTCAKDVTLREKMAAAAMAKAVGPVLLGPEGVTQVIKSDIIAPIPNGLPANFGQADCECRHCRANRANGSKLKINHDSNKTINKLGKNEVNRVALPGDVDYEGLGQASPLLSLNDG